MDGTKKMILDEVYKAEIAKFTREDFELVRSKVVEFAVAKYNSIFNDQPVTTQPTATQTATQQPTA